MRNKPISRITLKSMRDEFLAETEWKNPLDLLLTNDQLIKKFRDRWTGNWKKQSEIIDEMILDNEARGFVDFMHKYADKRDDGQESYDIAYEAYKCVCRTSGILTVTQPVFLSWLSLLPGIRAERGVIYGLRVRDHSVLLDTPWPEYTEWIDVDAFLSEVS